MTRVDINDSLIYLYSTRADKTRNNPTIYLDLDPFTHRRALFKISDNEWKRKDHSAIHYFAPVTTTHCCAHLCI